MSVTQLGHNCTECRATLPKIDDLRKEKRVTCSAKCRKRRERRMKDNHAAWIGAMHELQKMRDSIKRGEQIQDMLGQLNRLKAEINDLLHLAGDKDQLAKAEMLNKRGNRDVRPVTQSDEAVTI